MKFLNGKPRLNISSMQAWLKYLHSALFKGSSPQKATEIFLESAKLDLQNNLKVKEPD